MANKLGKHHICDACGETVFLARIFFTSIPDSYEDPPEGWMHFEELGDLCPRCATKLCRFIAGMFGSNIPRKFWKTSEPKSEKLNEFYKTVLEDVKQNKLDPYETYTTLLKQNAVIFPEEKK